MPLLLPTHFRGRLDFWDPALINSLADQRMILLLDNLGTADLQDFAGRTLYTGIDIIRQKQYSSPAASTSFRFWARETISFIISLGYKTIDVLGFSMGGFIAQMIALEAPAGLVRKLILAGTAPSQGHGVESGNMQYFQNLASATTDGELKAGFMAGFFGLNDERQKCGERWWNRITSGSSMWPFITTSDIDVQCTAMLRWYGLSHRDEGSYDRFEEIECPVLILCGQQDRLVPVQNSIVLWQLISKSNPNVQLHMYPDSGHGFLFEFHHHCGKLVNTFLDEGAHMGCGCQYCE